MGCKDAVHTSQQISKQEPKYTAEHQQYADAATVVGIVCGPVRRTQYFVISGELSFPNTKTSPPSSSASCQARPIPAIVFQEL